MVGSLSVARVRFVFAKGDGREAAVDDEQRLKSKWLYNKQEHGIFGMLRDDRQNRFDEMA